MKLERPKTQRVYVTLFDPNTNKSKSVTLYDATIESVIQLLKRQADTVRRPKPVAATA